MSLQSDLAASRFTLGTFALMGVFWAGFHSYAPEIKAGAGVSDWGYGVALFAASLGSLLSMVLAPWVERRFGTRRLLVAGLLMVLGFQTMPFVSDFASLIVAMATCGAGMGLLDVLMNAQVARDEASAKRSLMSLNHGVYSLVYAFAALIAAPLRAEGVGLGAFYLAATILSFAALWPIRNVTDDEANEATEASGLRLPPVVIWGGAIVLLGFACENAVESWSALHVERSLGGGAAEGPLGPAALGLTMAIGRLTGHRLVQRVTEIRLMWWASLLASAGAAVAALAIAPWMAYVGFAAAGLGISLLAPMGLALTGQNVPPAVRTRAISRAAVIGYLGFFFGPPLMGAVAQSAGLGAAFLVVAMVLLVVPVLLWRFQRSL